MLLDDLHGASVRIIFIPSLSPFSNTEETLNVIDSSFDAPHSSPSAEQVARDYGWEEDYYAGTLSWWQRAKPTIYAAVAGAAGGGFVQKVGL